MSACKMDAVFHLEERYSKVSIAYSTNGEKEEVERVVNEITSSYDLKPNIYNSSISGGREVVVIEYNDDYDRIAGDIFEKIIKALGITDCQ